MVSRPVLDYEYVEERPENPVMESTLHAEWGHLLYGAVSHVLAETGTLVTGNVRWDPDDDGPRTAPDLMVIPGKAGDHFGVYAPGPDDPVPSGCVEILSPSNTKDQIERRVRRMLELGVSEVYVLDPLAETVDRACLDGSKVAFADTLGQFSPALGITFAHSQKRLTVCCPAGLVVRPGDDPYGWIVLERARGGKEAARAARESARADEAQARAEAAQALAERYREQLRSAGIDPDR